MRFLVRRTLPLIIAASLLPHFLSAQAGPGRIRGRVQATEDGSGLSETSVQVLGTSLRTFTDEADVTIYGVCLWARSPFSSCGWGTRP